MCAKSCGHIEALQAVISPKTCSQKPCSWSRMTWNTLYNDLFKRALLLSKQTIYLLWKRSSNHQNNSVFMKTCIPHLATRFSHFSLLRPFAARDGYDDKLSSYLFYSKRRVGVGVGEIDTKYLLEPKRLSINSAMIIWVLRIQNAKATLFLRSWAELRSSLRSNGLLL